MDSQTNENNTGTYTTAQAGKSTNCLASCRQTMTAEVPKKIVFMTHKWQVSSAFLISSVATSGDARYFWLVGLDTDY